MYADSYELRTLKAQVDRGDLVRRIYDQLAVLCPKVVLDPLPEELQETAASFLGSEKALKKRGLKKSEEVRDLISHLAGVFFHNEDREFSQAKQGAEYLDAFVREKIPPYAYMYASDSPEVTGGHVLNQILSALDDVREVAGGIGATLITDFLNSEATTMDVFLMKGTNHDYRLDVLAKTLPELRTLTRFNNEEIHLLRQKVSAVLSAVLRQSSDSPTVKSLRASNSEPARFKGVHKSMDVSITVERLDEAKTHRGERVSISGLQVSAEAEGNVLFPPL
ncbi:MAG: hypothetical protein O3A00_01305 [Planctomycetota bacterium]|nr:hypothetical protein [Planctomycetota bacterium]